MRQQSDDLFAYQAFSFNGEPQAEAELGQRRPAVKNDQINILPAPGFRKDCCSNRTLMRSG
jgi:hypothetical protein